MTMNKRSEDFENKSKLIANSEQIQINLPVNQQGEPHNNNTRTTFKFEMSSNKFESGRRTNYSNGPAVEEKRPRKNQDVNNNQDAGKENSGKPMRMSRRASLAELFKIEEDASKARKGVTAVAAAPKPEAGRRAVSAQPVGHLAPPGEDKTKQDLIQNLGRLRQRRRSIREIQNRDELEGLMYVKQGDAVKLVSTTEGEEQAKEQRRMRRNSRKEEMMKVEEKNEVETPLSPVKEESPSTNKTFGYQTAPAAQRFGAPRAEPPIGRGRFESHAPQQAPPSRFAGGGRPQPKSFLPNKNEEMEPPKKLGSVADRMAYFRQQAAKEQKAASTSMPVKKVPAPVSPAQPTPPSPGPTSPTSPNGRASLKKAPDPSKQPRELKKKPQLKRQMSVSSLILTWCKDVTEGYKGVNITNFSGSFANGLAFCALIHKFNPDKFDFDSLDPENRHYNFKLAFETGESVGVPALLDVEDMFRMKKPEPRSVQCYVQMIFSKYRPKDLDTSNLIIA
ncbi:smoothelin-like protein 1 isoform X2 [Nematostella vectensis]|nr:smoothelin-like protein 1 isoform X2 [Nematostella vectensis]XP_048585443.1 smoothelin-like protein 1 isoform X2 [Nematostella vectensis]